MMRFFRCFPPASTLPLILISLLLACSPGGGDNGGAGSQDTIGGGDVPTCTAGLVWWSEHKICAPDVPDCGHPWEMPTVSGACVVIGPRACAKTWDPDAEVDCEAGELLPCPDGFTLTEDEVACVPHFDADCGELEIPVLGGGCKRVGPTWAKAGQAIFEECADGLLPLTGGGCVAPGPRACEELWIHGDGACEVGDVLPCPLGWVESADLLSCKPAYGDCPHGERGLPGGSCQRVIPPLEDCPPGPFPDAPTDGPAAVYVLAGSACKEGCGGLETPFGSIQAAVDAAPAGGYVLVGPGTYDEGLTLAQSVHLRGLCAAQVTLSGLVPVPGSVIPTAGISIADADEISISGIRVASEAVGVVVLNAKGVHLEDMDLDGVVGAGMYTASGSEVFVDSVWIHDTVEDPQVFALLGQGVLAQGGAQLSVVGSLVEATRGVGFAHRITSTNIQVFDTEVRDTASWSNGTLGFGFEIKEGATVHLERVLVRNNRSVGISVSQGAVLTLKDTVVKSTAMVSGQGAWGIQASGEARVTAETCILSDNALGGILATDAGTELTLSRVAITDNGAGATGGQGVGLWATNGAIVSAAGTLISGSEGIGLTVSESGTQVTLLGSVIQGGRPDDTGQLGWGMQVASGASVEATRSLLDRNETGGLALFGADTTVKLMGSAIRGTIAGATGGGFGIQVSQGAQFEASSCLVDSNTTVGLAVADGGSKGSLTDSVVRGTLPTNAGELGRGVGVQFGGAVMLSDCLFDRNTDTGVGLFGPGSHGDLSRVIIRETNAIPNGEFGRGMHLTQGATAVVTESLLLGNTNSGLFASGKGTTVELVGTSVLETNPGGELGLGRGLEFSHGAAGSITACLFEGNNSSGIALLNAGAVTTLTDSVIRDTRPNALKQSGIALQIGEGTILTASDCLFEGSTDLGVVVSGAGTSLELGRSVVRETAVPADDDFAAGIAIFDGAAAKLWGCLVHGNDGLGVVAGSPGSQVEVSGCIISEQRPSPSGFGGYGLSAVDQADLKVEATLVYANTGEGIVALNPETRLTVDRSAVLGTHPGLGNVVVDGELVEHHFGDGVVAAEGAQVDISSSVLADNARTGACFLDASGSLSENVIRGNASYGLALGNCAEAVQHCAGADYSLGDLGNYIFGNATALENSLYGDVNIHLDAIPLQSQVGLTDFLDEFL